MGALTGYVDTKYEMGKAEDAIEMLSARMEEEPLNWDVARLSAGLYIKCGRGPEAEEGLVKLVESEPSNYDLFLGLTRLYLDEGNVASAARVLTMSSEHLLAAGRIDEYRQYVNDLLQLDPDHVESLRLLVGLCTWLRDEPAYIDALKRLAASARNSENIEDERLALTQLTMVVPHEPSYGERLKELNALLGFVEEDAGESLFDKQFLKKDPVETYDEGTDFAFADATVIESHAETNGFAVPAVTNEYNGANDQADLSSLDPTEVPIVENEEDRLKREVDSIKFYRERIYRPCPESRFGAGSGFR